jgi:hypothetical protein
MPHTRCAAFLAALLLSLLLPRPAAGQEFPDAVAGASANFGRILGQATSYSPRVIQLVLRYRY